MYAFLLKKTQIAKLCFLKMYKELFKMLLFWILLDVSYTNFNFLVESEKRFSFFSRSQSKRLVHKKAQGTVTTNHKSKCLLAAMNERN